jgi:hypothetical protein
MPLDIDDIKRLHDNSYINSRFSRERGNNDLIFYRYTQWDDDVLNNSYLGYRGEFDMLKKAGRQILADLASNPVQVNFEPHEEDEEIVDLLEGMYRTDDADNKTIWSYENAQTECVICGFGAWKLANEYTDLCGNSDEQRVVRYPIMSANDVVFWDSNSRQIDKSDSEYCSYVHVYSERGYKQIVHELTGKPIDEISVTNFKPPEQDYRFPWYERSGKIAYIGEFYHIDKASKKLLYLRDPFGQVMEVFEDRLKPVMDEMIEAGYEIFNDKRVERQQCTRYIVTGQEILEAKVIAGQHIPIVPYYGEFSNSNGEDYWEGMVRLAKDPQRLRNFAMSYIADIVSKSPRKKPIYWPEQIAGYEQLYNVSGIDDDYPYMLQNRLAPDGSPLPIGPVSETGEQTIPASVVGMLGLTREAVEDVANPGVPQNIADPDVSGKAILAMQSRLDNQSYIYQHHMKYAKRRDGEVYASIASEIHDTPRKITLTAQDGSKRTVNMMQQVLDRESGELITINDIRDKKFDVYSIIGPSYQTQKDKTLDTINTMIQGMAPNDPMRNALMLKSIEITDGTNLDDIKEYAKKQLILQGIKQPETPEEQQMLMAAQQQGQQPSPEMVLAQAEMEKAKADQAETQRKTVEMQLKYSGELADNQIDTFDAQTKRMKVQVDAQKAGADINMKNIESFGKRIDNAAKIIDLNKINEMSDEEVIRALSA